MTICVFLSHKICVVGQPTVASERNDSGQRQTSME